ncbi:MAG: hypothetical protein ACM3MK_13860 [Chitinophagales bacterium]
MKKILIVVVSFILALGVFSLEGSSPITLLVGPVIVPLLLGPFLSTAFSFSLREIGDAFKDSFSHRVDLDRISAYRLEVEIIKNLESSILYWSFTIIVLAIIGILSSLTDVSRLSTQLAMAMISLLLGFGLRAILLTPMKSSIIRKLVVANSDAGE